MTTTTKAITKNDLRAKREELGFSVRKMAQMTAVSPKIIANWELGQVPMKNYSVKFVTYLEALDQLLREKHVTELTIALNDAIAEVAQRPSSLENQWLRMTFENALEHVPLLAATNIDLMNGHVN